MRPAIPPDRRGEVRSPAQRGRVGAHGVRGCSAMSRRCHRLHDTTPDIGTQAVDAEAPPSTRPNGAVEAGSLEVLVPVIGRGGSSPLSDTQRVALTSENSQGHCRTPSLAWHAHHITGRTEGPDGQEPAGSQRSVEVGQELACRFDDAAGLSYRLGRLLDVGLNPARSPASRARLPRRPFGGTWWWLRSSRRLRRPRARPCATRTSSPS